VSADLHEARVEVGEVVDVERLGAIVELTARLPHLAAMATPGRFAQLRCSSSSTPLLRRPMSVAWTQDDLCGFVFTEVGTGTRLLAALQPGDELDVLGPLGRGFSLDPKPASVLCICGGVGCAPFPLLISALEARGVQDITVLNGAAGAARLYPAERFARGATTVRVLEATEDGTRGIRGRVTELIAGALERNPDTVYACGPNAMLAAVADELAARQSQARVVEASLEAPMGCGFGTCLGCALPVRDPDRERTWALCCSDGPVMAMRAVDWPALLELPGAGVA
jgi:dihydroorotate dehydrogenase electron transfer subunit